MMQAMRLHGPGQLLSLDEIPLPHPLENQVLLEILACGVCRTDLHVLDAELPDIRYPIILGHEIVGRVVETGKGVTRYRIGDRIGVPWLGKTCGACHYCKSGKENLCDRPGFTGYTLQGGFSQYTVANAAYCLPIPERYGDAQAAPLLCAGLIGYRAYCAAGDAKNLGIYGFGAAAHLLAQVAASQGCRVFALTRPGDESAQTFARTLNAVWAGGSEEMPPEPLDAAIIFAPIGALVPAALRAVRKGGRVICAGIHMSDIPSFPYHLIWGERSISSIANLTRADGAAFMDLAATLDLRPAVQLYPLARANEALAHLKNGSLQGAAVLVNRDPGPRIAPA